MSKKETQSTQAGRSRPSSLVLLLSIAALLAPLASAQAQTQSGIRIFRDPVTGQLRAPSADEALVLDKLEADAKVASGAVPLGLISGAPVTGPVRLSNGTIMLELDESSLTYSVMTRGSDGKLTMQCVTGSKAATELVTGTGKAVKNDEEGHDHAKQ
jgi:hypothetical protein